MRFTLSGQILILIAFFSFWLEIKTIKIFQKNNQNRIISLIYFDCLILRKNF